MSRPHPIQSVVVIGSGNVATHLAQAFKEKGLSLVQVYSPTAAHAEELARKTGAQPLTRLQQLNTDADLYLISISDDQIQSLSEHLPPLHGIVAHTSGITALAALHRHRRHGVFYPLQTFSKNREVELQNVPFCIEAGDDDTADRLSGLAAQLSSKVYPVSTEKRKQLHLAAVLVNNFPTHLYHLAQTFLEQQELDFDLLRPLITETGAKMLEMDPDQAQTGPARRGDRQALNLHKELLQSQPEILALYELISNQIVRTYHE
ncbi:MAG: DUF2520 domain-containing protein [Bacteroidales bacterium]|nr:DUF2520 domain-containing protein [Bacteroidales bacterium]